MPHIHHIAFRELGYALYEAVGVPEDQAAIVTDHLVDANLFGHDSHGMIRTPGYLTALKKRNIKPVGELKIVRETPASAVIDAERTLGIVVAHRAMQMAVARAKQHTLGAVAVHQASHIGRLGDFPPLAAEEDCVGVIMLNGGEPAARGGAVYGALWWNGQTFATESHCHFGTNQQLPSTDARHHHEHDGRWESGRSQGTRRTASRGMVRGCRGKSGY